jgi:hypothetical protein
MEYLERLKKYEEKELNRNWNKNKRWKVKKTYWTDRSF